MAEIPLVEGTSSPTDRPFGITLLALLHFVSGLFGLAGGVGVMILLPNILGVVLGGVLFVLGLFTFVVGWGLWNLMSWAWIWSMIVNILTIIINLVSSNWIGIIIPLIIVIYLNQNEIKSRFR
ncbi:MAG: hypothetical protein ACTSPE_05160 [Candidatus Thorarchaeota archaeon]